MTTGAGIIAFGPLTLTLVMVFLLVVPGLMWSPIAGLISWHNARNSWLNGGREALVGVAYSICLLLPWILLAVALKKGRLSSSAVNSFYFILYFAWLIGPIVFFGQAGAQFEVLQFNVGAGTPKPDYWLVAYSLFFGMLILWIGSGFIKLNAWWISKDDVTVAEEVMVDDLIRFRFIMPYALAWGCTVVSYGYLIVTAALRGDL